MEEYVEKVVFIRDRGGLFNFEYLINNKQHWFTGDQILYMKECVEFYRLQFGYWECQSNAKS